jgi:hypothetical protein
VLLTENADYVSTCVLICAILSCFCDSAQSLLVYRLVAVVQKIDDLFKLSDVGVWRYLGEESAKTWRADLYDRRYETHKPLKRK